MEKMFCNLDKDSESFIPIKDNNVTNYSAKSLFHNNLAKNIGNIICCGVRNGLFPGPFPAACEGRPEKGNGSRNGCGGGNGFPAEGRRYPGRNRGYASRWCGTCRRPWGAFRCSSFPGISGHFPFYNKHKFLS